MENVIIDEYLEHRFHKGNTTINKNTCSTCWNECELRKRNKERLVPTPMDSRERELMDNKMELHYGRY
jgi:hypothetical protein